MHPDPLKNIDAELTALKAIIGAVAPLSKESQIRVLASAAILLGFVSNESCQRVLDEGLKPTRTR
jgi:hypothetical protein